MVLAKEEAKKIRQGDFIPDGDSVDIRTLRFRKTREDEVFQCCRHVGYDPQSGPMYCGDIAEYVAYKDSKFVATCDRPRHRPPKNLTD